MRTTAPYAWQERNVAQKLTADKKRLALLGLALAFFWPTMHNELMYPVMMVYRNTGSVASYPLHILYLASILVVTAVLATLHRRIRLSPRLFCILCGAGAACGLGGGILLDIAALDLFTLTNVIVGVGVSFYAIYYAVFFMLAFAVLSKTDSRLILPCIFLSYVPFCLVKFMRLRLSLFSSEAAVIFTAILPVVSCLLLMTVKQEIPPSANSLKKTLRMLPWATIASSLVFIYLATAGTALFNISADWANLPSTRGIIYLLNFIVCLILGIVSLVWSGSKWLTLGTLSALVVYLIAALRLSTVISTSSDTLNLGTTPLIAAKLTFELFLLGACAKACCPTRKHAAPFAPIVFFYLAFASVLPDFVSTGLILSERYVDVSFGAEIAFMAVGAAPVLIVAIITAILLHQLAHANNAVALQKERRDRASAEEFKQAIAQELDLSPREAEITFLLCCGQGAKAISDQICISESTVYAHMKRVYRKLGLHSKQELVDLVAERVGPVL